MNQTTAEALRAAGMLELAEAVCAQCETTLSVALRDMVKPRPRLAMWAIWGLLTRSGWTEEDVAREFGASLETVQKVMRRMKMSELRPFLHLLPRKAS